MILTAATVFYFASLGEIPGTGAENPYAGAVEVSRFSFENDSTRPYDGDRDYDGQPDDWIRRRGPGFPHYIQVFIDRNLAYDGSQSLHYCVNGGQVAMYSPITDSVGRIDPRFSYVFRGYIRTQRLEHDAAIISVSFLNHKRERIQRFLSRPVSGTHQAWVAVTLGPMAPQPDTRFVVIGCHLVHDGQKDFRGDVWFDDLWLARLPRLSLLSNFATHFKDGGQPIEITSTISGLDPGQDYRLELVMEDSHGNQVAHETVPYHATAEANAPAAPRVSQPVEDADADVSLTEAGTRFRQIWKLPPQEYGFYRVRATLMQGGATVLSRATTFAVMDLVSARRRSEGEFGWTIARRNETMTVSDLVLVASEAGINWLKFPLWQSATSDDPQQAIEVSELFESLSAVRIVPVGLLNDPPTQLREQFASNWQGVSEVFSMPLEFWSPFLEPVVARYSSSVRHWQLGGDQDTSFQGLNRVDELLARIKREFDRIGRDTRVGLHWDWETPLPRNFNLPQTFLSVGNASPLTDQELSERLRGQTGANVPRWVVLKPLSESTASVDERASDLVKRMVAAKIGHADAIFAWDVFDTEFGMLHPDGSPKPLFLSWRTAAVALQGSEYLGSFRLPDGSTNYAFARDGRMSLFVWNDAPTTEKVYLGENVQIADLWGRRRALPPDPQARKHIIPVGPVPTLLLGCSEAIARWRLAVRFQKGRLRSEYGGHQESLLGTNMFPQGINGTVSLVLPRDWEVEPRSWTLTAARDESLNLPMTLTLPADASLGTEKILIDFDIVADRRYQFRVERPYQVGLGDISLQVADRKLDDGRLEIEQIITNTTDPPEILNFRCALFVPGHKRQKQFVTKLGNDKDKKYYYIPNADELLGRELRLRAEQINGRRVLNKRWIVGETWDSKTKQSK